MSIGFYRAMCCVLLGLLIGTAYSAYAWKSRYLAARRDAVQLKIIIDQQASEIMGARELVHKSEDTMTQAKRAFQLWRYKHPEDFQDSEEVYQTKPESY